MVLRSQCTRINSQGTVPGKVPYNSQGTVPGKVPGKIQGMFVTILISWFHTPHNRHTRRSGFSYHLSTVTLHFRAILQIVVIHLQAQEGCNNIIQNNDIGKDVTSSLGIKLSQCEHFTGSFMQTS